uniref:Uncharacterized protein n=1 Tax=Heterorhabditis bacteriophora TaxID=37862 RepID=A0A1I7WED2_HETBA
MHNWLLLIIAFYSKILTNLWLFPIFFSVIFLKKPPILSLSLFNISTREPKQILSSQTRNERLYEENDILRQYKSTILKNGLIEKEVLALVLAIKQFHCMLHRRYFKFLMYLKPLEMSERDLGTSGLLKPPNVMQSFLWHKPLFYSTNSRISSPVKFISALLFLCQ